MPDLQGFFDKKDKIPELYYQWGEHWRDYVRVTVQRKIKDVSPRFATLDYFTMRYYYLLIAL